MYSGGTAPETLPVVAGVDGTRIAPVTIELAAAEAARLRAPLLIVHVWPGRYTGFVRSRGVVPTPDDGRHLLDVALLRGRLVAPELSIHTELLDGGAAHTLTECSRRARLIVVGHRDDVLTRPSWGSTTAYLAHHSACPLLVHRGSVPHRGPVVAAVSGRPAGAATLGYAFAEAAQRGVQLVAIHMWTRPATPDGPAPPIAAGGFAPQRREAERVLAEALARWTAEFPGVPVEPLVVHDLEMGYTIERASRRGQLLVAGIGRHGRFAELLYRSLSPAAMRAAACPVVLVPTGWTADDQAAAHGGPIAAGPR